MMGTISENRKSGSRELLGIGLLSAAALTFEISLTRLFALQQYHHFAFVVISLALMGFAASGTLLSLWPNRFSIPQLGLAFAASVVLTYLIINIIPFDSYSIVWNPKQLGVLLLYFLCAGLPFLFAGWAIGLGLSQSDTGAHWIYGSSLTGSALGCLIGLVAFQWFGDVGTFAFIASMGLVVTFILTPNPSLRGVAAITLAGLLILGWAAQQDYSIQLSPYKPLAINLHAPDARQTFSRWDLAGRVDIVESQGIHVFPGLSLKAPFTLPEQIALYINGDGPYPITRISFDNPDTTAWSSFLPSALAYQLRPSAKTLLLRPGTGLELVVALESGAKQVDVVQDHPLVMEILQGPYREYSGNVLNQPQVKLLRRGSRAELDGTNAEYDVINFALSEPYRPIATGAFSLGEYYPLTIESLEFALEGLKPNGMIVLTQWLSTPPIESARVWATVLEALRRFGIEHPQEHLVAFRSMRTGTILVSKTPFTDAELAAASSFMLQNGFDPISMPDLDPSELNRFNRLPHDRYHQLFAALLKEPDTTIREYPFNLFPPSDNRPYFYHFFRMQQTPDVIEQLGRVSLPFGGSGYLVLFALLVMMGLLAIPIVLIPVLVGRRTSTGRKNRFRVVLYFAAIGAGYLLVEIPLIQQMGLVFDQPAIALAATLFILLLSSGIGSLFSPRVHLRTGLLGLIAMILLLAIVSLPAVEFVHPLPFIWRITLSSLLIIPLGFLMGMPFISGLRRITKNDPDDVPWVWAINGAASGIFGVIAAMIALGSGFGLTLLTGALAYFIALIAIPLDSPEGQEII